MTARKPEPLCPYRHFIDEDTRNPRGLAARRGIV